MATHPRIYTRTGDGGLTRLGDCGQVSKAHPRVEACGAVDELNAAVGVVLTLQVPEERAALLRLVQHELFDLGADLSTPLSPDEPRGLRRRVAATQVAGLERQIDRVDAGLPVLRGFVVPGGHRAAAWLHLARTVCRRAERRVWALAAVDAVNPQVAIYLNRLSDLLFLMAREANQEGGEVLLAPARKREVTRD